MMKPDPERGAALLSILVIVAALAVAALMVTTSIAQQTDLTRTAGRRSDASWAAYSAEALALSAVAELAGRTNGQLNALTISLSEPIVFPIRGGVVSLEVSDASNCFNLNSLANPDEGMATLARLAWTNLLQDLDIPASEAASLTNALADWIDRDTDTRQGGAEDGYYMTLQPAYRAANQFMDSPRELAAVMGYNKALRDALTTLACTRPTPTMTSVNINTLRPEQAYLLRAVYSESLTLASAERLLAERPETGWPSVDVFESLPDIRAIPEGQKRSEALSTTSTIFQADGRAILDGGSWPFSFLISAENGTDPQIVWRRTGEE